MVDVVGVCMGDMGEWSMVGEVVETGKWIHRLQLDVIVDWRTVIRRIWLTKSLLHRLYRRYAEDVHVGVLWAWERR